MSLSKLQRKATLETNSPEFGSSFSVKCHRIPCCTSQQKSWHRHQEMELVYVRGGCGKRHIGNNLSCYQGGDLVFIGSNLPHSGFVDRLCGHEAEINIHFNQDFLGEEFFEREEMRDIKQLFEKAKGGIAFDCATKLRIGAEMEKLMSLDSFDKLLAFLKILKELAQTDDYQILNANGYAIETDHVDHDRINEIFEYTRSRYKESITLNEISAVANMTVPAFCRYFKRITGKTYTQFVNEMRIVEACRLIGEEKLSITNISFMCGFNNFSYFNRVFKKVTGLTPSAYRSQMHKNLNVAISA